MSATCLVARANTGDGSLLVAPWNRFSEHQFGSQSRFISKTLLSDTTEKSQLSATAFWISSYPELQSSSFPSRQRRGDCLTPEPEWPFLGILRATTPPTTIPQSISGPTARDALCFCGICPNILLHTHGEGQVGWRPEKLDVCVASLPMEGGNGAGTR